MELCCWHFVYKKGLPFSWKKYWFFCLTVIWKGQSHLHTVINWFLQNEKFEWEIILQTVVSLLKIPHPTIVYTCVLRILFYQMVILGNKYKIWKCPMPFKHIDLRQRIDYVLAHWNWQKTLPLVSNCLK